MSPRLLKKIKQYTGGQSGKKYLAKPIKRVNNNVKKGPNEEN